MRIFIWLSVIFCLLAGTALWYVQRVFLPEKLKPLIIEMTKDKTGAKIGLENIYYNFPHGFSIHGLTLYENEIPSQKFLIIKETNVIFKPMAIFLKKQLVITRIELKTLEIFPGPGHTFTSKGDIFIDGEFILNLIDPKIFSYTAVITLKDQDIKHMPFVKDIAHLNGRINAVPNKISIIDLKGSSFGCPVEFSGFLENFKDPYLDLTENINLDLTKIDNFVSAKISSTIKPITFTGKSAVMLHMSGKFSEWPLKFNGSARVINAEAKIKNLANPLKSINGDVSFDENSILVPSLEAQYNDAAYTMKANFTNFSAPSVYMVLNSQDLILETKIRTMDDYVRFDSIEGTWFNSNLNLVGEIQNYQKPELKLSGDASLNLEDIQKILSRVLGTDEKINAFLNNLKPKGVCNMSVFFDGLLADFANCEIGIKANAENLSLSGFNLGALDATAQLKNKELTIPKFDLSPYSGTLKMQTKVNFSPKNETIGSEYNIDIKAAKIDLSKLIKDTGFKDKNIRGSAFFDCSLLGTGNDLNNLKGQGWILISDGHLWEFPLLGGLADVLHMAQLKNIEVNEAAGNFTVANGNITTQNLAFSSPQLNMEARGSLGLHGNLDFNAGVSFAPGFAQANQLTKLAMFLVDETGRFLGQVKLSGTLKEPKYTYVPLHLDKIVNKIKEIFKKQ